MILVLYLPFFIFDGRSLPVQLFGWRVIFRLSAFWDDDFYFTSQFISTASYAHGVYLDVNSGTQEMTHLTQLCDQNYWMGIRSLIFLFYQN